MRFPAAAGALLLVVGLLLVRARPGPQLLLVIGGLGWLLGTVAWARERTGCAARLPAGALRLEVRLAEPADVGGGRLAVVPIGAGCRGGVTARWPRAHPVAAGRSARVEGRWIPRPGPLGRPAGTLVVSRVDSIRGTPGAGDALRNALTGASRRLYGPRAPIVDALVLGRRAGMDRELQQRFADAGLVHLLSISGFHVGLIAAWVLLVARLLHAPPARAYAIAAAVGAAYVAFLGWPAPATRAAALAALLTACRVRQRCVRPDALLVQTCLAVVLVDPWALADLGAWLSAASLWGATAATRWSDRALGRGAGWRMLSSSVGATAATAPLTAGALGTVAVVGVALNFAAIPLAAVAVPGVIASLLAAPLPLPLADGLAAGAGFLLHLLELLAAAGAAVPGGHVVQAEGPASALPWLAVLLAALWGIGRRNSANEAIRRWGWLAVVIAWALLARALAPAFVGPSDAAGSETLALHFLDVGQGDGAVLRTPGGRWIVVDAGPRSAHGDAGRRVIAPFLARQGARRIEVLVVSHAHADHLGGAAALLNRFPTALVAEPGERVADPLYLDFLGDVAARGARWHAGRPGERFTVDGVRFTVLHPDTAWVAWGTDLNEDSLVLLVEYGAFRALFAGDAGLPAEERLRGRIGRVSLLKVGHHGSAGATGDAWLAELQPRAGIVSVGAGNRYGHPAPAALARLAAHEVAVWRTDEDGTITVTTDGTGMTIRGRRGSRTYATTP